MVLETMMFWSMVFVSMVLELVRVWVDGGECIVGRHAPQLAYMEASCCKAKYFVRARAKGSDKAACLAAYRFAAGVCFECGKVGRNKKPGPVDWAVWCTPSMGML